MEHLYDIALVWTGDRGEGTTSVRSYDRRHEIRFAGKAPIVASADAAFRGDPALHNPEELLVAALSSCHMLSFLHLCALVGVVVTEYTDSARGAMTQNSDGGGHFTDVVLNPRVRVTDAAMLATAEAQHETAHQQCFIAQSVNFPVRHRATIEAHARP